MTCDPHRGCITCGDVAVEMRVVAVRDEGLALCEDDTGERREVETALVADTAAGDVLLVHADVALTRIGGPA
jgi:hydrogenase expression/formation protein HypC